MEDSDHSTPVSLSPGSRPKGKLPGGPGATLQAQPSSGELSVLCLGALCVPCPVLPALACLPSCSSPCPPGTPRTRWARWKRGHLAPMEEMLLMPGSDRVFLSPSCQGWRPPGRGCLLGGTCLSLARHVRKVGLLLPAEAPEMHGRLQCVQPGRRGHESVRATVGRDGRFAICWGCGYGQVIASVPIRRDLVIGCPGDPALSCVPEGLFHPTSGIDFCVHSLLGRRYGRMRLG